MSHAEAWSRVALDIWFTMGAFAPAVFFLWAGAEVANSSEINWSVFVKVVVAGAWLIYWVAR